MYIFSTFSHVQMILPSTFFNCYRSILSFNTSQFSMVCISGIKSMVYLWFQIACFLVEVYRDVSSYFWKLTDHYLMLQISLYKPQMFLYYVSEPQRSTPSSKQSNNLSNKDTTEVMANHIRTFRDHSEA